MSKRNTNVKSNPASNSSRKLREVKNEVTGSTAKE